MTRRYTCPHCGQDITAIVAKAIKEERDKQLAEARSVVTPRRTRTARSLIEKVNQSYTPEKRREAAKKRLATLAARRKNA